MECDRCGKRFTILTNYIPHKNTLTITRRKKLEIYILCEDCRKKAKLELDGEKYEN